MAVHGTVGEFSGIGEEWPTYIERLEFYFAANEVDSSDKRRAILLSCCGAQTYGLIRSLVGPGEASGCFVQRHNRESKVTLQPEAISDCRTLQVQLTVAEARGINRVLCCRATQAV